MIAREKKKSIHALEASNFFLADVQTGLGPFLAAYLAGAGWGAGRVGIALTVGGIITVVLQTPAGAIVDQMRSTDRPARVRSTRRGVGGPSQTCPACPANPSGASVEASADDQF